MMFEDEEYEVEVPARTYKVINNRIVGRVDELEAMKQAIHKALSTERFTYEIYSESYGHDLEDLIGQGMDLAKAEVERLFIEALEVDDRILSVANFNIIHSTSDSLFVSFVVNTIFGDLEEEAEITL